MLISTFWFYDSNWNTGHTWKMMSLSLASLGGTFGTIGPACATRRKPLKEINNNNNNTTTTSDSNQCEIKWLPQNMTILHAYLVVVVWELGRVNNKDLHAIYQIAFEVWLDLNEVVLRQSLRKKREWPDQINRTHPCTWGSHVSGFSDPVDLWVIKEKAHDPPSEVWRHHFCKFFHSTFNSLCDVHSCCKNVSKH